MKPVPFPSIVSRLPSEGAADVRGTDRLHPAQNFLPRHTFRRRVKCYGGDRRVRTFTCWNRFLAMAFAQFTYRESLRDIEA